MAPVRSTSLEAFSQFLGWGYFIAWSISFWPQTILNFKRKSVSGLSLDFELYNLTGFAFYTVYTITSLLHAQTPQYVEDQRAGAVQSVEPNDIAFGVHAVVATCICLYQFHLFKGAGVATLTPVHSYIISILWALVCYNLILILAAALPFYTPPSPSSSSTPYSFIDYLGYGKAAISFIKYVPQAYLNYQRQSTVGWSIVNILLDFTGGSLSFAQQFIEAWNRDDGGVIWGNVPKLILALESIGFDVLFMVQHYVLYVDRRDPALRGGNEALLKKEGGDGVYHQIHSPVNGARGGDEDEKKGRSVAEVQL